jgi:hypothetical protein
MTAAHHPSDREVLSLIKKKREAFRAERKRAGRDELLKVVMDHFGLPRKGVLAIWNSAPRDRKGGSTEEDKSPGLMGHH